MGQVACQALAHMRNSYMGQVACQAKLATNICLHFAFILRFILRFGIIYDDVIETLQSNQKNGNIFFILRMDQIYISNIKFNSKKPCTWDLQCGLKLIVGVPSSSRR